MKQLQIMLLAFMVLGATTLNAQKIKLTEDRLQAVDVSLSQLKVKGKRAIRVVKDTAVKEVDEPTFVRINGINFTNGTIEVKVLSRLLKDAPVYARGFIGLAFRINDNNTKYESIYIRPTNGRADDQVRRNHSIQYYAYPDHKFDRLRKEAPEKYESYADMTLDQWITLRVVVNGSGAKLFINDNIQPSLVVNDLKHGANASGAIGLWVEIGTEGYFRDLKVHQE